MIRKIAAIVLLTLTLVNVQASDINAKLACKGTSWLDGKQLDNKQGFISISNGSVQIDGMLNANGTYKVDLAGIREDYLGFKSQVNPRLHGSINRVTGEAIVIENDKIEPTKGGQALFHGTCTRAKQIF